LSDKNIDVNKADEEGHTPLVRAIGQRLIIVKLLLEHGADVNKIDKNSVTQSMEAAFLGAARTAQLLLEHGADVNKADEEGFTPLNRAALWGRENVVRLLLDDKSIDVNRADKNGVTPLSRAISNDYTNIATLLLEHGADHAIDF